MPRNKKSYKIWWVLFLVITSIILVAGVTSFVWWQTATKPVKVASNETLTFIVGKGMGVNQIASKLKEENVIKSELAFKLKVKQLGIEKQIQAGSFKLTAAQNTAEIAQALTKGSDDVWVTVLEGLRMEEVAESFREALASKGVEFDPEKFLEATKDNEGFLFPDTYLIPLTMSEAAMADLLVSTFDKKVSDEMEADASSGGRTLAQIVTMASLIEREARTDESRKMVAGILWKRLANDWPLQVDATLQYASGYDKTQNTWWREPLASMKEIDSAYNTYKNVGLPPGPIASPSLSSIMAAIYPTESEYWYYLTDMQGRMHYGRTLDEHNQNIQEFLR